MDIRLTPRQQAAYDTLTDLLTYGNVATLMGASGTGKSTLVRKFAESVGAKILTPVEFVDSKEGKHPFEIEESFFRMLSQAFRTNYTIVVEDLELIRGVVQCYQYPLSGLLDVFMSAALSIASASGKRLVFVAEEFLPSLLMVRGFITRIESFTAEDYRTLLEQYLPEEASSRVDCERVFKFAPHLNCYQLVQSCIYLRRQESIDTDAVLDHLKNFNLASNVDLERVEPTELGDLKGMDEVLHQLDINVVLPLQNDERLMELDIQPKKGILLYGPPGTGKTTIGKALAHKLGGKFFLVDGRFISQSHDFYGAVRQVFEAARENAPSVVFIDDSDVLFEDEESTADFYRYLLSTLDGLESENGGRICVVMTAMNVATLPPALIRSGRIELWLEVPLPGLEARQAILEERLSKLPPRYRHADIRRIAEETSGFTGADLKRIVEDAKNLIGYDILRNLDGPDYTRYFLEAISHFMHNRNRGLRDKAASETL